MPVLKNARHEKFAQALAKGMTATDAYSEAGYKGDRTAAASRLSTNVNINRRNAHHRRKLSRLDHQQGINHMAAMVDLARTKAEKKEELDRWEKGPSESDRPAYPYGLTLFLDYPWPR
ncbi:hypothetical protein HGP14_33060 [Rhizobium sp. P32RR-XVIII]|uniref:hypothetical protein n=1 Tax=Rhizobium sp. P32RR-XVIII TaxID=2726738 RepID=UPI0014564296|nr:hypothetical protein [Rhizobium sp. P32RR-XVIII]NLS08035.1 hypothetical protein [Rhizobium sp. P32RR-XVIII]